MDSLDHSSSFPNPPFEREAGEITSAQQMAMLRRMVDSAPTLIAAFDLDGRYLSFNQAYKSTFLRVFHTKVVVGMKVEEALASLPEHQSRVRTALERVIAGETYQYSDSFKDASGTHHRMEVKCRSLCDDEGKLIGAVSTIEDRTERYHGELALRASESRLAQAQSVTKTGSWEYDLESEVATWSAEMFRLFEFDPADGVPVYERFIEHFHPDDVALHAIMQKQGQEEGSSRDFEFRVIYSDGRLGWMHAIGRSEKNAEGKIIKTMGTVTDITPRKVAEAATLESEERLRAIVDQMPVGIIFAEAPGGRKVLSNREMARILGRPAKIDSNVGEHNSTSLFLPDGTQLQPHEYPLARAILRSEVVTQEEVHVQRADGTRLVCVANASPIYNKEGEAIAAVLSLNDIDEQRKLQQQFEQSQKMESIGRLANGIAHDFNNILSVIMGYTETMDEDLPDESDLRSNTRIILDTAARAKGLTKQLLSFAKPQPAAPTIIAPHSHIENMFDILRQLIGADIALQTRFTTDVGRIIIDPHQLEQIVVNLVVNARDAMPKGGSITLETSMETVNEQQFYRNLVLPSGDYVRIAVSDTGSGMSEEVQAKIFEPFFSTKDSGKGSGLGLATVYGIVKQNDGHIRVTSQVGAGTSFTIYLPRVESEASSMAPPESSAPKQQGSETVLVAEDEIILRELIVFTLRHRGYTVLEAENGVEALEAAESHAGDIHLLITDAIMPIMGGHELTEKLRRLRPEIKILMASGYTPDRFSDDKVLAPDAELLTKPFTPSQLLETVRRLLSK